MPKKKLAIISSHPIQYNAPLFKLLAERNQIDIRVFYSWGKSALDDRFDPGFDKVFKWDIPLLDGYDYEFLENSAKDKGSHHYKGIVNPDIISRINLFSPDALLIFGWAFNSHLQVLRVFSKNKLILFRGDSTLLDKSSKTKDLIRSLFLKWVYKHVDFALYVGQNNYKYYRRAGLRGDQLLCAPHAIDNERFSRDAETRNSEALVIKQSLDILPGELVYLYAGKLEEVKNVRLLVKAFIDSELYKTTHLVIVGNGLLEKEIKASCLDFKSVHFMDFQNQGTMPIVYRVGDVFILPSKSETWGLAVNEAMACGRTVIVSDHCGCALDLVVPGSNGYIFESGNSGDLAKKMKAIESKDQSKKMGAFSRSLITDFSYLKIAEVIENVVSVNQK